MVALDRPGDLNLRNVELSQALFMISEQWGINVVAGDVKGSVNGVFRQAPLREILDSILLSNGYNYRPVGESLVVSSVEQLGQINPFFQSATIPVRSADIDEVVQGAKLLTTPKGQVQAIKSAHCIVVLDFPDRVKMIREFVNTLDAATAGGGVNGVVRTGLPLEVGYFRTQHITAKAAEDALAAVMSKEGRVAIMEKEDRLIVSDHQENLAMVEAVLKRIDRPRPQVRITALIYDISLQDIQRLGINWNSAIKGTGLNADGDPTSLLGVDSVMQVPFESGATGSAVTFMNLSRHLDITAVILALNNANDARLLADPSVAVLENEDALFQSVTEIPFQQLTQTSAGGNIGTTSFKEAGITLKVRPKIAADGTIRMDVSPEFSRLTGFTPGDHQPIIDRRTASTTLMVANGQTVVIGGLRQRQDVGDFKGVPYLMDMRVVGKLFRSRDTNVRESELVVFISPEIIDTADPLNRREQMIVDTLGCRLNQIPEGEGCLAPGCGPTRLPAPTRMYGPAVCPTDTLPAPQPTGSAPNNEEPLPPPEEIQLNTQVKPTTQRAIPLVRRLPNSPEHTTTVTALPSIFPAPPAENGLPNDDDPQLRSASAFQVEEPAPKPSRFREFVRRY